MTLIFIKFALGQPFPMDRLMNFADPLPNQNQFIGNPVCQKMNIHAMEDFFRNITAIFVQNHYEIRCTQHNQIYNLNSLGENEVAAESGEEAVFSFEQAQRRSRIVCFEGWRKKTFLNIRQD